MRIAFVGDSLTEGLPGSSYFAILREKLPHHTLVNLGRGNDTVVSLYQRISRLHFVKPFDVAFLWVGVNDVVGDISRSFRIINKLQGIRASRNVGEFRAYYQATLKLLCCHAQRVIAVSAALKGEDVSNAWNRELAVLSGEIEKLASQFEQVEYLDLRAIFAQNLAGKSSLDYLPSRVLCVALDALTLRTNEQIDRKSAARGLHLTLDGIHLNSVGARLVAETFGGVIACKR